MAIKIVNEIGHDANRALLVEVPRTLANSCAIKPDGTVELADLIKLVKAIYLENETDHWMKLIFDSKNTAAV